MYKIKERLNKEERLAYLLISKLKGMSKGKKLNMTKVHT